MSFVAELTPPFWGRADAVVYRARKTRSQPRTQPMREPQIKEGEAGLPRPEILGFTIGFVIVDELASVQVV
jgi:hypothetical protein